MLHITNGDSTRIGLEASGLPGRIQPWRDILHEGPVPTGVTPTEFRRLRSEFLAAGGPRAAADIERGYTEEDAAVTGWRDHDEVVLWFEHDLYDQLLLVRLLSLLPPDAAGHVSLVCGETYLGPLRPDAFPPLFATRQPITAEQIALGTRVWKAFGADSPEPLRQILDEDTSVLPFLDGALRRHLDDYPDEHGIGRSERQILIAVASGLHTPGAIFRACAEMEERVFMGDSVFWSIVARLASGQRPLLTLDPPDAELSASLPETQIALTDDGRDVLAGRADQIALNGIGRWMGGVFLTPERPWRRSSSPPSPPPAS